MMLVEVLICALAVGNTEEEEEREEEEEEMGGGEEEEREESIYCEEEESVIEKGCDCCVLPEIIARVENIILLSD